jgi:hypothetical protein
MSRLQSRSFEHALRRFCKINPAPFDILLPALGHLRGTPEGML